MTRMTKTQVGGPRRSTARLPPRFGDGRDRFVWEEQAKSSQRIAGARGWASHFICSNHRNLGFAPDLVQRDFEPSGPNQLWASDITYIGTDDGWAYLAVVLDLYSRKVVGWAIAPHRLGLSAHRNSSVRA